AVSTARRAGDKRAELFALFSKHDLLWTTEASERLALATEILGLATAVGDSEMIVRAHLWRRRDLEELGDRLAADQELEVCARLAQELRQPRYQWQVALARAMRALMHGQFDAAQPLALGAWQIGKRGAEAAVADEYLWMQLFTLRRVQGRLGELEAAVENAAHKYTAFPGARAALAVIYCELNRRAEARAVFESLVRDRSF